MNWQSNHAAAVATGSRRVSFDSRPISKKRLDTLDAQQLTKLLHLSRAGTYNLMNRPDFPTLKIGSRKRVVKKQLIDWLERQTNRP